jgi:hypothetical protein
MVVKTRVSPLTVSDSFGTPASHAKALPLVFWQSVQWQIPANSGSADVLYRTAPHTHPPLMVVMSRSPPGPATLPPASSGR